MIKTLKISHPDSAKEYESTVCLNEQISAPQPGILVFPTFMGLTDFEREKARELANLGYVALAVDIYGDGQKPETPDEARVLMNELNENRSELLKRCLNSLETLKNLPQVDKRKLGAIGFCFGGKCVLDLVRANSGISGGVSFHGVYDKPPAANKEPTKCSILVLHGWEDPLGKPTQLIELAEELTEKNADWQILAFGNTGHSFTNPAAHLVEAGMFYQQLSDKRSWQAMKNFFTEIFA